MRLGCQGAGRVKTVSHTSNPKDRMREPLPAGCRVRGGADTRELPTKKGASARIMFHQSSAMGPAFLAQILGIRPDLTWPRGCGGVEFWP